MPKYLIFTNFLTREKKQIYGIAFDLYNILLQYSNKCTLYIQIYNYTIANRSTKKIYLQYVVQQTEQLKTVQSCIFGDASGVPSIIHCRLMYRIILKVQQISSNHTISIIFVTYMYINLHVHVIDKLRLKLTLEIYGFCHFIQKLISDMAF